MKVYFDNAATSPVAPEVFEEMIPFLRDHFGNPNSQHSHGRENRSAIEKARKLVAQKLGAQTNEIFFTSGGTESDNTAILGAVKAFGLKHIITSPLEHHAVLHTVEHLAKEGLMTLHLLKVDQQGNIDFTHLEELLKAHGAESLVTLMHGNNEIGNLLDLEAVGELAHQYGARFHTDAVQTVGHYPFNLSETKVDFLAASAHKFNGPKGIGILYVAKENKIGPFIHGGGQERGMRGGTENVASIVGMAKALEIAHDRMEADISHGKSIKSYLKESLEAKLAGVQFNGRSGDLEASLYGVLNVSLPSSKDAGMLLFSLDLKGISASGGSACSSGALTGSHVLTGIKADENRPSVRFSFGRYNTKEEVDYVVEQLLAIL
ncbi:cysteine desulfurase family protein [Persicobacter sp. CCB-QB2]|uniref:cysteine desulfurase family protein n=1 Tax=Persicobacter sp. CCB-QB2 TaxID=1561025 RepID=UPI0006A96146|nr:cysteine desulfurase family protein [Persicobacter sp. CCB-QB2]